MKKKLIGLDVSSKKSVSLDNEKLGKLFSEMLQSVTNNESDWKKYSFVLEFESRDSDDEVHIRSLILRSSDGKVKRKKVVHSEVEIDFVKELKDL